MSDSKSDLMPRLVTAVIGIPILLAIIFLAPPWGTFLLVAGAGAVTAWEFCGIIYGDENLGGRIATTVLAPALGATVYFFSDLFFEAFVGATMLVFIYFLFAYRDQKRASQQITASLGGLIYGGVLLMTLSLLHKAAGDTGPYWFLMVLVVTWLADTGAYFVGKAFGSHSLYEDVSPNKSVEGSIGGLAASIGGAFLCNYLFGFDSAWEALEVWQLLALAVPANILGQLGDLCVSLLKRAHEVKDTGTIIYGHGGILERIDALIFASPWFYVFYIHFVL
mgnify:CR=1 FL=1